MYFTREACILCQKDGGNSSKIIEKRIFLNYTVYVELLAEGFLDGGQLQKVLETFGCFI